MMDSSSPPLTVSDGLVFYKIPIFYATDRNNIKDSKYNFAYGNIYSDKLKFGIFEVTIPKTHSFGTIDTAPWWEWDKGDPEEFMTLYSVKELNSNTFYKNVEQKIKSSTKEDVLVFIHGYNNSFNQAALRAGQIILNKN